MLKENTSLKKDVTTPRIEVSEASQNTSFDASELQKIVKLLKSDLEKMMNGSKNLDLMLGSQRPYFDKMGLGFEKEDDEKLAKNSQSKIPTCIYYFKKFSRSKAKRQKAKKP